MPDDLENSIPQTAEEAEALMQSWDAPEVESDMQAPEAHGTEIAPADGQKPEGEPQPEATHNLNYKGKEESYPLSKIIEFAQQGRDYAQKMGEFNSQRIQFAEQVKAFQSQHAETARRLEQYAEIEAYQKQDPAWWQHVVESYQARQGSNAGAPSAAQLPPAVASKIENLEKFVQTQQQKELQQQQTAEDTELDSVITGYKGEFKQFDWSTKDDKGRDLERQILDHAIELGITTPKGFRAAANDYLFKQHVERAKVNGKVDVGKQIQKTTKLGLGPVTPHPTAKHVATKNPASKSYDELEAEALKQLGL